MDFRNYTGSKITLGLKNNNPLNVKSFGFTYTGQIGKDNHGHAIFSDTIYGIRAGGLEFMTNLKKHKLNTISKQIDDWAAGNRIPYKKYVSEKTGISEVEDLTNISFNKLKTILQAMSAFEITEDNFIKIPTEEWTKGLSLIPTYYQPKETPPAADTNLSLGLVIGLAAVSYFLFFR